MSAKREGGSIRPMELYLDPAHFVKKCLSYGFYILYIIVASIQRCVSQNCYQFYHRVGRLCRDGLDTPCTQNTT